MAISDEEMEAIKRHPTFLKAEKRYRSVWSRIANRANARAARMEERELGRHKAAMQKIAAIRDQGRMDAVAAARNIEDDAFEAALKVIRALRSVGSEGTPP